jgi:hypothetical protein
MQLLTLLDGEGELIRGYAETASRHPQPPRDCSTGERQEVGGRAARTVAAMAVCAPPVPLNPLHDVVRGW